MLGKPKHGGKDEENLTHFFRHYQKASGCVNKKEDFLLRSPLSDPLGVRTQDPNIKSVVLYQLS